jgi:non-specific serine/threonine protein kinase
VPVVHLPRPRTRFIGREGEIASCAAQLGDHRLVTIVGPGGSGKTRLALRVAETVASRFSEGVWFVDLAAVAEADRVPDAVVAALGLHGASGAQPAQALAARLAGRTMLIVLDNCEHVLAAAASLADRLLAAVPGLRLLATSREGLALEGERLCEVGPLAVPARDAAPSLEMLGAYAAIDLFVDRARDAVPGFALDAVQAPAVAEICRRLDGIPLAIELAAARVKLLSVEQIRARLVDRFRLLATASRASVPRQRTLAATVQWSYDLLTAEDQALLRQLGVFAGGWTLEAAAAVAGCSEMDMLDRLTRLVDKSLVVVERQHALASRYRMLETVREFAVERLAESQEAEAARGRHLDYFVKWVGDTQARLTGPQREEWLVRFDADLENVLAALEWCEHVVDGAERGIRIAGLFRNYLERRAMLRLALQMSRSALRLPGADEVEYGLRRYALLTATQSAQRLGLPEESRRWAVSLVEAAQRAGELKGQGIGYALVAAADASMGRYAEASASMERAVDLGRGSGEPAVQLGMIGTLAETLRLAGRLPEAQAVFDEARAGALAMKHLEILGHMHWGDTMVKLAEERRSGLLPRLVEGLDIARSESSKRLGTMLLAPAGASAMLFGDAAVAARLLGAGAACSERIESVVLPPDRAMFERYAAKAREALGEEAFRIADEAGRALSYESAFAEAVAWARAAGEGAA